MRFHRKVDRAGFTPAPLADEQPAADPALDRR
jgi:hypothetical protein